MREAIEELIEETPESDTPISDDQRVLLANILKLRDKTVADVMVPRVDIVAIAADTPLDEVVRLIQTEAHSRYPIYRELLDDVIGMIHIKDVLAYWGTAKKFNLRDILRRVVFVAPTLPVLDMLLDMRRSRTHMALVVDEFGGTDGLLTIEDLVEEIVGEIEDEHDVAQTPTVARRVDGTIDVNGRTPVELLEQEIGSVLSEDERREIDTVGGLIFSLLGRIPERGEVVRHPSGVEFECSTSIRGASGACACGRRRRRSPPPDRRHRRDEASGMARPGRWPWSRARSRRSPCRRCYWLPLARGRASSAFVWLWDGAPTRAQRRAARLGLGHRPFRRRLLLDARGLLRAAGRLRAARPADRARPGGRAGLLSRPRRPGRRKTLVAALAASRRPLSPAGPAGDRLDG